MKQYLIKYTILFFITQFKIGNAQTIQTIELMSKKHQACLDSGVQMLKCSRSYYFQMDSTLNVVYNKLKIKLNTKERDSLKRDEIAWIKKKDIYFKKQNEIYNSKFEKGEWGSDMYMITYDNDAEFIKARIIVLLNKLNKL
jgi:uncharacterized protein YecT (DUF1311 family)